MLKRLSRIATTYILGDLITRGGAFLLLPLYTRFIPPEGYGILALTALLSGLLGMVLSLGFTGAVLRFYPRLADAGERRSFLGTLWAGLLLVCGAAVGLLLLGGDGLLGRAFRQVPFHPYLSLTLAAVFFQVTCTSLLQAIYRAREQAAAYVAISVAGFLLLTVATLALVVVGRMGAAGAVLAQAIAAAAVGAYAAARLAREVGLHMRRAHLLAALGYGLPLVPHLVGQWALNAADRLILERYVGLADLGVYALAYQFGAILSVISLSLSNALTPTFSRVAVDAAEGDGLRRAVTYYTLLLALAGLGLALLSGELIALLLPAAYLPAGPLIPWIVLGCCFLGASYSFSSALAFTAGRTASLAAITAIGAAANIGLNLLLVPRMGVLAAAIATAAGYAALALPTVWLAVRGGVANFEYRRMLQVAAAALLAYALARALMRFAPAMNIGIGLSTIAATPALLYAMGFWRAEELAAIRHLWRREAQGV